MPRPPKNQEMKDVKMITIRVPNSLRAEFKAHCARRGLLMGKVLRDHIESVVNKGKAKSNASRRAS